MRHAKSRWSYLRLKRSSLPLTNSNKTNLLDLPNELLVLIFGCISVTELCCLSLVSRRIHYVALPIYLAHYDIYELSSDALNISLPYDDPTEALRGLRLALFVKSIHSLDMAVPCVNGAPQLEALRELGRLVLKLSSIGCLSLDFGEHDQDILEADTPNGRKALQAMDMLTVALAGKSCRSLRILQSTAMDYPREIADPRSFNNPLLKIFFYRSSKRVDPLTSLSSFHTCTSGMFLQPLYDWTISSLNASPLTRLEFNMILTPPSWNHVLPQLNLPNLLEFSISCHGLSLQTISQFFSRHLRITALRLHFTPLDSFTPSAQSLAHLETLVACPEVLGIILGSQHPLPSLKNITVIPYPSLLSCYDFNPINRVLRALTHVTAPIDLHLTLIGSSHCERWMEFGSLDGAGERIERSLRCVQRLYLHCWAGFPGPFLSPSAVDLLPHWLSLFPALTTVHFELGCLWAMALKDKINFVRTLSETCPILDSVGIDSVRGYEDHKVFSWLAMY